MKIIRSAGIIIYRVVNGTREYLLLLYPGGYWEFPKGKLEPGETREMAAHRELKEETNLQATLHEGFFQTIAYTFKDRQGGVVNKEVYFFVGYATSHTLILSHEHRDALWLTLEQALHKITHQNAQNLLKKADEFLAKKNNE